MAHICRHLVCAAAGIADSSGSCAGAHPARCTTAYAQPCPALVNHNNTYTRNARRAWVCAAATSEPRVPARCIARALGMGRNPRGLAIGCVSTGNLACSTLPAATDLATGQFLQSMAASCLTLWFLQLFRAGAQARHPAVGNTAWLAMTVALVAAIAGLAMHHSTLTLVCVCACVFACDSTQ